jgi:hypothetical protein
MKVIGTARAALLLATVLGASLLGACDRAVGAAAAVPPEADAAAPAASTPARSIYTVVPEGTRL